MSEKLPEHKVTEGSGEDLCNKFIAEKGYNEEEAKIAREAFKHSWVCAFNRSEKKSDFENKLEMKQKLYEISDLNEVLRSFLREANNSDTDAGITVTGCIRDKIEAALNMVEV